MPVDDRPLQENRTIIVLPWDVDSPEWIKDEEGNLLPIKSLPEWFQAVKPEAKVEGLVGLDGEEKDNPETFEFQSMSDFRPEALQERSATLQEIITFCEENEKIAKKLSKSKKLRQLLGE